MVKSTTKLKDEPRSPNVGKFTQVIACKYHVLMDALTPKFDDNYIFMREHG